MKYIHVIEYRLPQPLGCNGSPADRAWQVWSTPGYCFHDAVKKTLIVGRAQPHYEFRVVRTPLYSKEIVAHFAPQGI